mgnify:CR=1 FL=1
MESLSMAAMDLNQSRKSESMLVSNNPTQTQRNSAELDSKSSQSSLHQQHFDVPSGDIYHQQVKPKPVIFFVVCLAQVGFLIAMERNESYGFIQ